MVRPTTRLAWLFALSVPLSALLLAGFKSHYAWALIYPGVCLLVGLTEFMLGRLMSVEVKYEYPTVTPLGQEAIIYAHLATAKKSPGYKPIFELVIELMGPLADADSPKVTGTMTARALDFTVAISPKRRGRLDYKTLWLRWKGPFGLVHFVKKLRMEGHFTDVVQSVKGVHEAALSFFLRETEPGQKSLPFRGEGTEFDSLVEYYQGMDHRTIDWKRSARHHKLLAKDFRQERNHNVILAFDTGRLMTEPVYGLPKLDHYVKAALLMAWVGLQSGDRVGAVDFSLTFKAFLKPGGNASFFSRIQRFTAGLSYGQDETNFAASLAELRTRVPQRSLIIFFTEFIDVITAEFMIEALAALAKKHAVIFVCTPDPLLENLRDKKPTSGLDLAGSVIADSFIRDRAIVLQRVTRLGVQAVSVPPKALSTAILNKYLTIKQRGLL